MPICSETHAIPCQCMKRTRGHHRHGHSHPHSLRFAARKKPHISFPLWPEKSGRKFHWIKSPSRGIRGDLSPLPTRMHSTYRTVLCYTTTSRTTGGQNTLPLNQSVADRKQQLSQRLVIQPLLVPGLFRARVSPFSGSLGNPLHRSHRQTYNQDNP